MSAAPADASPANAARGEASLRVAGEPLALRPSFAALVAAEAELGPLFDLIERAAAGRLSLGEMVALFWHCRRDVPATLTREALGEAVVDAGLAAVTPALKALLHPSAGGPVNETFAAGAVRLAGQMGALLGWSPDAFWRATPAEVAAIVAVLAGDGAAAPPDAATLGRLMRSIPMDEEIDRLVIGVRAEPDWLAAPLATLALCWRIERRDGVTIGLTDHDRDLTAGGLVHRASPGMTPSAIRRACGTDADTMQADGALTSGAISERDLLAGRWDGARVVLSGVDWSGEGEPVALGEGRLGSVELDGDAFSAELTGIAAALDRPVIEATSPECRAELGDRRCRVAMAGRRRHARVAAQDGATLTFDAAEPAANAYGGGRLVWLGGDNAGLESAIARSDGSAVTLRSAPVFVAIAGTLVELVEGCDKSLATCAGRFGNAANFRGEPYLPGIDLLTRYPGE